MDVTLFDSVSDVGAPQWRAESIQLVNWGGFVGHHSIKLDPSATLLTGHSGTGKSTLLDAITALLMPSSTRFNEASADASMGRARRDEQRSLFTYLTGKLDDEPGEDGGTRSKSLRNTKSPFWGAVAMTYTDNDLRFYTALRAYYVASGASDVKDINMSMATIESRFELDSLERAAESRFDVRSLRGFGLTPHDTYVGFSATLFEHLGIGKDGKEVLGLLGRIQSGEPVKTVDDLYSQIVLERPATYDRADSAVQAFGSLRRSYDEMVMAEEQLTALDDIERQHARHSDSIRVAGLIESLELNNVTPGSPTPIKVWANRAERALIDGYLATVAAELADAEFGREIATSDQQRLQRAFDEAQQALRDSGGDRLESLEHSLAGLRDEQRNKLQARANFERSVADLNLPTASMAEFDSARRASQELIDSADNRRTELELKKRPLDQELYRIEEELRRVRGEVEYSRSRTNLIPKRLHDCRVAMAEAAGMDPAELPFVGELIDLHQDEEAWRPAAEAVLRPLASILLIEREQLTEFSRAINTLSLDTRLRFEGVTLRERLTEGGDRAFLANKLVLAESKFEGWIFDRLRQREYNARCVADVDALNAPGDEHRVAISGQTRQGTRGAHGGSGRLSYLLGFSNKARLEELEALVASLTESANAQKSDSDLIADEMRAFEGRVRAATRLFDVTWDAIDIDGVAHRIAEVATQMEELRKASDQIRVLEQRRDAVRDQLATATSAFYSAQASCIRLGEDKQQRLDRLARITLDDDRAEAGTVTLSDAQGKLCDGAAARVGAALTLDGFTEGLARLQTDLLAELRSARDGADDSARLLTNAFARFRTRWPSNDLGVDIDSYGDYQRILDRLRERGLAGMKAAWQAKVVEWGSQDLLLLSNAFADSMAEIRQRLAPVNEILAGVSFGPEDDRLRIESRPVRRLEVQDFLKELKYLVSETVAIMTEQQIAQRFRRMAALVESIKPAEAGTRAAARRNRLLDVRRHMHISAARVNALGETVSTYAALGGKSGGESQELTAFITGAALRFKLGSTGQALPRYAPVFLDEGFVKADPKHAGRAVTAWRELGFQLIIGAPIDKVTALEPHMARIYSIAKSATGRSYCDEVESTDEALVLAGVRDAPA